MPAPRSRTLWSFVFKILFYCEDDDDVKRLAMRLVVDGNKYQKMNKS
jgi:hypothetical protein